MRVSGYTGDNRRLSWSGYWLNGDRLALSVGTYRNGIAIGNLFAREGADFGYTQPTLDDYDIEGRLMLAADTAARSAGFNYYTDAYGSALLPVAAWQLPGFVDFDWGASNALVELEAGPLTSKDFVCTWDLRNRISAPRTQTLTLNGSVNQRSGQVSGNLAYSDQDQGYARTGTRFNGVVLQKTGEVRGFYGVSNSFGSFRMTPNFGGTAAPVTTVGPRAIEALEAGGSFVFTVVSSERWSAVVPISVSDWVSVNSTGGVGDGSVVVNIAPNFSNVRRETIITIAGLPVFLSQRQNTGTSVIPLVSITPSSAVVSSLGRTYRVLINSSQPIDATQLTDENFSSPVDWVTMTSVANALTNVIAADIVVEANAAFATRQTVVVIAGIRHTITQSGLTDR